MLSHMPGSDSGKIPIGNATRSRHDAIQGLDLPLGPLKVTSVIFSGVNQTPHSIKRILISMLQKGISSEVLFCLVRLI